MMNAHPFSVGNYGPSDFAINLEPAGGGNVPTSAGTFMLRRALYFSNAVNALFAGEQYERRTNTFQEVAH